MDPVFPKRLFKPGNEPEVEIINNSCKMALLKKIREIVPAEYKEVQKDPVFSNIIAILENGLGYSARLIHSMMTRQLKTKKKHELWFVFAGRPLRFSLQEFCCVTGLSHRNGYEGSDLDKYDNDHGFWSKIIASGKRITINKLLAKDMIKKIPNWRENDKKRLVYICLIVGIVVAQDGKKPIDHTYIKVVMDFTRIPEYPWGRIAFDHLMQSIIKIRKKLWNRNYLLDGFSFALQIWAMEAIPVLGSLVGNQITDDLVDGPRCSNWKGVAKLSFDDIIRVETTFKITETLHPYLSSSGNVVDSVEYYWGDEIDDDEVANLKAAIRDGSDFANVTWDFEEPVEMDEEEPNDENTVSEDETETAADNIGDDIPVSAKKITKRDRDHGAESRKKKILCQRAASSQTVVGEDLKSILQGIMTASFSVFEDLKIELRDLNTHFKELKTELQELKTEFRESMATRNTQTSTCPSQAFKEAATSPDPAKVPEAATGPKPAFTEAATSVDPTITDAATGSKQVKNKPAKSKRGKDSQQPTRAEKLLELSLDDDLEFLTESQVCPSLGTQEYLHKMVGALFQDTTVPGFDPSQPTDSSKLRFEIPTLSNDLGKSFIDPMTGLKTEDYPLLFVDEDAWNEMNQWTSSGEKMNFGPSIINRELLTRIITPKQWFGNEDMDAFMFLLRENASLGRVKADRVGFMDCMFSTQMKHAYTLFRTSRKEFKFTDVHLNYGNGLLPAHGRTGKRWARDVDLIYIPVHVKDSHWIALCVHFHRKTIEILDCYTHNQYRGYVDAFKFLIPRLVKEVQEESVGKQLRTAPYTITRVPMQAGLNKSACDCGAYALKFIECHLLGLSLTYINEESIMEARHKIALDIWQAAKDPIFIDRMSKFKPVHYVGDPNGAVLID